VLPHEPGPRLAMLDKDVHVWRIHLKDLDREMTQLDSILSRDEWRRAQGFRFERDQRQFTLSHWALRTILSKYLKLEADEIEFTHNRFGKPRLVGYERLKFNLSHSGGMALVAIAENTEVGVDVEVLDGSIGFIGLAKRFFSETEYQEIVSSSGSEQSVAFFRCWTGKEAIVKAKGEGLSIPLDSFSISLTKSATQVVSLEMEEGGSSIWTLESLDVSERYFGSVAYEGRDRNVVVMDW